MRASEDIHARLEHREQILLVKKFLEQLPENQQIAFTLSRMDAYSNGEIATIMQTTIVAVESLIHRAKKKLTEKIQSFYERDASSDKEERLTK